MTVVGGVGGRGAARDKMSSTFRSSHRRNSPQIQTSPLSTLLSYIYVSQNDIANKAFTLKQGCTNYMILVKLVFLVFRLKQNEYTLQ